MNKVLSVKSGKVVGRQGISKAVNAAALEVPLPQFLTVLLNRYFTQSMEGEKFPPLFIATNNIIDSIHRDGRMVLSISMGKKENYD